jgi:hypothetical protein
MYGVEKQDVSEHWMYKSGQPLRDDRSLENPTRDNKMSTSTLASEPLSSVFASAPRIPADAIFALTAEYLADTFPQKVNLGQGAYRDDEGQPWVLPSVRESRRVINEGLQHEYLPILGLQHFRDKAAELALGPETYVAACNKVN